MADVAREIFTARSTYNGSLITYANPSKPVTPAASGAYVRGAIWHSGYVAVDTLPASGVGNATGTKWDDRYDDIHYYVT